MLQYRQSFACATVLFTCRALTSAAFIPTKLSYPEHYLDGCFLTPSLSGDSHPFGSLSQLGVPKEMPRAHRREGFDFSAQCFRQLEPAVKRMWDLNLSPEQNAFVSKTGRQVFYPNEEGSFAPKAKRTRTSLTFGCCTQLEQAMDCPISAKRALLLLSKESSPSSTKEGSDTEVLEQTEMGGAISYANRRLTFLDAQTSIDASSIDPFRRSCRDSVKNTSVGIIAKGSRVLLPEKIGTWLNNQLDVLHSLSGELKENKLREIVGAIFEVNLESSGKKAIYELEVPSDDSEVACSPLAKFRQEIEPRGPKVRRDLYCRRKVVPFLFKYARYWYQRCVRAKMNLKCYLEARLADEMYITMGTKVFEAVPGHEAVEGFFRETLEGLRARVSTDSSDKICPLGENATPSGHEVVSPAHASISPNLQTRGSKITLAEDGTVANLQRIAPELRKIFPELSYAIDATMIFFCQLQYVYQLMQDEKTQTELQIRKSQEDSMEFILDYWTQFFNLGDQKKIIYEGNPKSPYNNKLPKGGISISLSHKQMLLLLSGPAYRPQLSWAGILMRFWISQDPTLKPFSDIILSDKQANVAFQRMIKHQVISEVVNGSKSTDKQVSQISNKF